MTQTDYAYGYVLGVLLGDGSMSVNRGHYTIRLDVTDKAFSKRFEKAMEKVTGKKAGTRFEQVRQPPWSKRYTVKFYSKYWYIVLKRLKEQILLGTIPENRQFSLGLLKGFFDSEGSISNYTRKRGGKSLCVSLSNTNLKLLQTMKRLLERFGISVSGIYPQRYKGVLQGHRLNIARKPQVALFRAVVLT